MSSSTRKHGKYGNRYRSYTPTPETSKQVMAMTGYGIKQEDIAAVLDMHPKTLRQYYRRELDTGATEANARVVQALFKNAVQNESVAAQVWWTKVRMGWRDGSDVNIGGTTTPLAVSFRWADATPTLPAPEASTPTPAAPAVKWIDIEAEPNKD